ncbi:hypothetical protein MKK58_00100 [Methylobacterium sp. J-078]|uniref:hypothetical protein n=1 Tax=Methylobacterium sp. J-078 TaxID=2836657 RepID=UPI001FBB06E4|nr:hypothetical protein [Methylobacterium sp. J-078]MCJ2042966.1 hypothetical protein [Methylobacterium sp. J-078]
MFHAAMQAVIEAARTSAQMDEAGRQLWQGHASGVLTDEETQELAERLHGRRSAIREAVRPVLGLAIRRSVFPPRRVPVSPDRIASRDRRRLLSCSGPLPPALAARFTEGQRAVLRIVADEVAAKTKCLLCVDAIAARAGVSRRLAQMAIRLAEGDGLITVQERRNVGRKNDPNVLRIISREWQAWIKRGGTLKRGGFTLEEQRTAPTQTSEPMKEASTQGIGCKALHPTDRLLILGTNSSAESVKGLPEQRGLAHR